MHITDEEIEIEVRYALAERRRLHRELSDARREASCCDDIKLDQPLAGIIADLQADRERLRGLMGERKTDDGRSYEADAAVLDMMTFGKYSRAK